VEEERAGEKRVSEWHPLRCTLIFQQRRRGAIWGGCARKAGGHCCHCGQAFSSEMGQEWAVFPQKLKFRTVKL